MATSLRRAAVRWRLAANTGPMPSSSPAIAQSAATPKSNDERGRSAQSALRTLASSDQRQCASAPARSSAISSSVEPSDATSTGTVPSLPGLLVLPGVNAPTEPVRAGRALAMAAAHGAVAGCLRGAARHARGPVFRLLAATPPLQRRLSRNCARNVCAGSQVLRRSATESDRDG